MDRHRSPPRRIIARRPPRHRAPHHPARRLRREARHARLRRDRARRPRRHRRHLPRRRDRRGIATAALRRDDPRPARQPRLPHRRRRRRPAHRHHPRRAAPTHRSRPARPHPGPRRHPTLGHHTPTAPCRPRRRGSATPPPATTTRCTPPPNTTSAPTGLEALDRCSRTRVTRPHRPSRLARAARAPGRCSPLDGHDPAGVLADALAARDLDDARDPAAVLDWRLNPHRDDGRPTRSRRRCPGCPPSPPHSPPTHDWGRLPHRPRQSHRATRRPGRRPHPRLDAHHRPGLGDRPARPSRPRPSLVADLAVWRAAQRIPDTEPTAPVPRNNSPPTPTTNAPSTSASDQAARRPTDRLATARRAWSPASTRASPPTPTGPHWPTGSPPPTAPASTSPRWPTPWSPTAPLPDEYPAAALWWRLTPAPVPRRPSRATAHHSARCDRSWTAQLRPSSASRPRNAIIADPAWPALVAAVTHATDNGWQPGRLLGTAYDLLDAGHPDDAATPDELATALVWRIGMLTDSPHRADSPDDPRTSHAGRRRRNPHLDADPAPPRPTPNSDIDGRLSSRRCSTTGNDAGRRRRNQPPVRRSTTRRRDSRRSQPTRQRWTPLRPRHRILRARLIELNSQAAASSPPTTRDSWAPGYLADRLGPTSSLTTRASPLGYAPPGWTHLTDHLRRHRRHRRRDTRRRPGQPARTGRLIDRFRDRLVFPIWQPRTRSTGSSPAATPPTTTTTTPDRSTSTPPRPTCSTRATQLFGLHEARDLLSRRRHPGPRRRPAGRHRRHPRRQRPLRRRRTAGHRVHRHSKPTSYAPTSAPHRGGIIVATDNDPAGRRPPTAPTGN